MDRMESDLVIHDLENFKRWLRSKLLESGSEQERIKSTIRAYVSGLRMLSRDLKIEIGPETIGSQGDADELVDKHQKEQNTGSTRNNRSAARNYAAFVQATKSGQEAPDSYNIDSALRDLFVNEEQLARILDSIKQRKNLILQGPPGVGKTFIARRIAWCLIGRKDSSPIEMVQFHQSYAYEDFVQGWRPTETGGFTLRNGVFFEFCKRAGESPNGTR